MMRGEFREIGVLCHRDEVVIAGKFPNLLIGNEIETFKPGSRRIGKEIIHSFAESKAEVLIEKEFHSAAMSE